ncbi:MAG TPA: HEPN domain-containing protein [Nitrospira sp.]|jgi:HEPN domain-containing protein|nr:HEPN domain-containing protein [Nitrospira sp.]HNK15592.1 HEPN domain-containing protein [Nitrospira sp.]HNL88535.1 HEPN domain-containing protein [Nitrospira sp.]HNN42598.1 HEPN domain-containing protein [Nitrospira sp.]HUM39565.1 HEPN domain-containing protein [Nitrospira sp.]
MQPETAVEARAWFQKATNDLRGADIDLAAAPPLVEDALFHCQQAAEKAMKGYLTAHERVFRKTHDLDELARACEAIDPTLKAVLLEARDLTVFAWEFRYPGDSQVPSEGEAVQTLALARQVVSVLLDRLPPTIRP